LELGPAVLREDHLVALGDVHLDVLARLLVASAGANHEHFAPLRLFLRRVGQHDPAHRQLLLIEHLDDQAVTKRLQIHEKTSLEKLSLVPCDGLRSPTSYLRRGVCGALRERGNPFVTAAPPASKAITA